MTGHAKDCPCRECTGNPPQAGWYEHTPPAPSERTTADGPPWSVEDALTVLRSHRQHIGCMFDQIAQTLERAARLTGGPPDEPAGYDEKGVAYFEPPQAPADFVLVLEAYRDALRAAERVAIADDVSPAPAASSCSRCPGSIP